MMLCEYLYKTNTWPDYNAGVSHWPVPLSSVRLDCAANFRRWWPWCRLRWCINIQDKRVHIYWCIVLRTASLFQQGSVFMHGHIHTLECIHSSTVSTWQEIGQNNCICLCDFTMCFCTIYMLWLNGETKAQKNKCTTHTKPLQWNRKELKKHWEKCCSSFFQVLYFSDEKWRDRAYIIESNHMMAKLLLLRLVTLSMKRVCVAWDSAKSPEWCTSTGLIS